MSHFIKRSGLSAAVIALVFMLSLVAGSSVPRVPRAVAASLPFKDYASFAAYVQSHQKAPFDHAIAATLAPQQNSASIAEVSKRIRQHYKPYGGGGTNIKVNQDLNPWPKAELGAAVDPKHSNNYVVMTNDFRQNVDHEFYHSSTDGGKTWIDDSMTAGLDPIGFAPYAFQSDPSVAFDGQGHSFVSAISGNITFDLNNDYVNLDTAILVTTGYNDGTYTDLGAITVDAQPCNGKLSKLVCPAQLDKPLITVDTVPGSPNYGRVYAYYTLFCLGELVNGKPGPCHDGTAVIPPFSSAILESHANSANGVFSPPALISGPVTGAQFSDMVIDSHGTPHIFFDDFKSTPTINMYESTLSEAGWTVSAQPVVSFTFNGLNTPVWTFRSDGTVAPGCSIHLDTAYCAFSASRIGTGPAHGSPSVYLATVNTQTGASRISRVNNDPVNNGKAHFFPWASTSPNGVVYVGWYDNRNDQSRFAAKVEYFVGKSTDGGAAFPRQQAVSDTSFNPCAGGFGCTFFGDYVQLVTGSDAVTHAAWSDTRDGATIQIYSQAITW